MITLSDAEQKVQEVDAKLAANRASARAPTSAALEQKRDKALADVQLEERRLAALTLHAPVDGPMMIGQNWRAGGGGPFGAREWRTGDRAWPGANIGELPELGIAVRARRRSTRSIAAGCGPAWTPPSSSRRCRASSCRRGSPSFSTLAKPDFTTWPPPRMFDVNIDLDKPETRLRPGMTASIRVPVEKLPGVLLVPTRALMQPGGAPFVFVLGRDGLRAAAGDGRCGAVRRRSAIARASRRANASRSRTPRSRAVAAARDDSRSSRCTSVRLP